MKDKKKKEREDNWLTDKDKAIFTKLWFMMKYIEGHQKAKRKKEMKKSN